MTAHRREETVTTNNTVILGCICNWVGSVRKSEHNYDQKRIRAALSAQFNAHKDAK